jgi:hypothetical protein
MEVGTHSVSTSIHVGPPAHCHEKPVRPNQDAKHEPMPFGTDCGASPAEPGLVSAGLAMVSPARALLARLRSPLLTVWRARSDAPGVVHLSAWTDRLEPDAEMAAQADPAWPELAGIRTAGAEALRQLSCRWPPYAQPPVVGLVTDGTGLAVSGEHPSGLSKKWLADQLEGGSPASIILPFDRNGLWALISGPSARRARRGGH